MMLKGLCHGWLVYFASLFCVETCSANKFSKTTIEIHFNLLHVCPTGLPFVFAMLFITCFNVLSGYFYVLLSVVAVIPLFEL